jgi:hypothetical protein
MDVPAAAGGEQQVKTTLFACCCEDRDRESDPRHERENTGGGESTNQTIIRS